VLLGYNFSSENFVALEFCFIRSWINLLAVFLLGTNFINLYQSKLPTWITPKLARRRKNWNFKKDLNFWPPSYDLTALTFSVMTLQPWVFHSCGVFVRRYRFTREGTALRHGFWWKKKSWTFLRYRRYARRKLHFPIFTLMYIFAKITMNESKKTILYFTKPNNNSAGETGRWLIRGIRDELAIRAFVYMWRTGVERRTSRGQRAGEVQRFARARLVSRLPTAPVATTTATAPACRSICTFLTNFICAQSEYGEKRFSHICDISRMFRIFFHRNPCFKAGYLPLLVSRRSGSFEFRRLAPILVCLS